MNTMDELIALFVAIPLATAALHNEFLLGNDFGSEKKKTGPVSVCTVSYTIVWHLQAAAPATPASYNFFI